MTLDRINACERDAFVAALGAIYEDSPWVAERTFEKRPFASAKDLGAKMQAAVECAPVDEQLALLRAHPDLGTRAKVSESSAAEQAGAGLNALSQEEFAVLTALNRCYRKKFGFPFIYAVKGSGKQAIMAALELRCENTPEVEFREALNQVFRIARFRLRQLITG